MNITQQHMLLFRALGHPIRINILKILAQGPACVCDLVSQTGKRQPCISQHLAVLRQSCLVNKSRQGWNIYYELNKSRLLELEEVISGLLQQVHSL